MPLSGSRTSGSVSSLIPRLEVGYMRPCILFLGSVPHLPHADSHHSYRPAPPCAPINYKYHSLVFLCPISSLFAELYFFSSIIISPVSIPAHVLEPLNFDPTHLSWPLTLEPSINSWILSRPNQHVCHDCLRPALDLAVALAEFLFLCIFSCEDTHPKALVLSRQPLTRALL